MHQAQSLVPDLRLQIRALTCSAISNYRVPDGSGAAMVGSSVNHSRGYSKKALPITMSQSELSRSIEKLGAERDWEGVWKLIDDAWTSTTTEPDMASMQQLIEYALAKNNGRQVVRLAQKLWTITSRNRLAANAITDEWIGTVLCSAVNLTSGLASSKNHPFVDFTFALFLIDVTPGGPRLDREQSRVLQCVNRLLASNSVRGAGSIKAELNAVTAKYVVPLKTDSEQSAQGPKWTRSYLKHGDKLLYPELKKWYIDAIARFEIPTIKNISQLLNKAQKHGDHEFWETVICQDFPKLMSALESTGLAKTDRLFKYYKKVVWSLAISTYASRKELDKVIEYFGRIINAGSFPASSECIELLKLLENNDVPLPVLPMGRSRATSTICGMKPAYPPQSKLSGSKFIDVESSAHRSKLIAQMGLAMLYSSLQHKEWPNDYFYALLLGLLARAQMINELQHIFKVVMPEAMRSVPDDILNPLLYETSPLAWTTAIQAMSDSGKFDLAKQWFDEYRADVMPKLCESSLFAKRWSKLSVQSRLAMLAEPYYSTVQIVRPLNSDGTSPTPWYNLQQVERLLELDQMREQDKLVRSFDAVVQLLHVFTETDEHFDMDQAEALIKDVGLPYSDTQKSQYIQPESYFELVWCYRMMVEGYLTAFQQQKNKLGAAYKTDSGIVKTKERIKFWYYKLALVRKQALRGCSKEDQLKISLTKKRLDLIHSLK